LDDPNLKANNGDINCLDAYALSNTFVKISYPLDKPIIPSHFKPYRFDY